MKKHKNISKDRVKQARNILNELSKTKNFKKDITVEGINKMMDENYDEILS